MNDTTAQSTASEGEQSSQLLDGIRRAISVRQPWTWAIIHGGKDVENRTRRDPWRKALGERIWVHAARTVEYDDFDLVRQISGQEPIDPERREIPLGVLIGSVVLRDVHHATQCAFRSESRDLCSPWAQPDQWHLVLRDPIALPEPIAWRGALGLFEVSW